MDHWSAFLWRCQQISNYSFRRNLQENVERIFIATTWRDKNAEKIIFNMTAAPPRTQSERLWQCWEAFPGSLISGSDDLSRFDFPHFFLWGYLKSKIYVEDTDKPNALLELKQKIAKEINELTTDVLGRCMEYTEEDALLLWH